MGERVGGGRSSRESCTHSLPLTPGSQRTSGRCSVGTSTSIAFGDGGSSFLQGLAHDLCLIPPPHPCHMDSGDRVWTQHSGWERTWRKPAFPPVSPRAPASTSARATAPGTAPARRLAGWTPTEILGGGGRRHCWRDSSGFGGRQARKGVKEARRTPECHGHLETRLRFSF